MFLFFEVFLKIYSYNYNGAEYSPRQHKDKQASRDAALWAIVPSYPTDLLKIVLYRKPHGHHHVAKNTVVQAIINEYSNHIAYALYRDP